MFNIQIFVITTERCKQHQCQESVLLTPVCVWKFRELCPGGCSGLGHSWYRTAHPKTIQNVGKTLNFHPGVIFVSLAWKIPILHGKMLDCAIRCLCFTQILADSDHTASKIFSPNTTAGRSLCLGVFNDIFPYNSSGNESIKQCQTLNKALGPAGSIWNCS